MFPLNFSEILSGFWLAGALWLGSLTARADVQLPAIFGDHMVLQQEATLPVWGRATPGEKITVTFSGRKAEATATAEGKWRADLPALAAGTSPGALVVTGKNTVTINDVLVGEVWLCGGQSNMEYGTGRGQTAKAKDDQIRLFHVPHRLALAPVDDVRASWEVCTPETVPGFSAVGFFFAQNLRTVLKRPVGLIESCVGGTGAQEWTDLPTLRAVPALRHYAEAFDKIAAAYPGGEPEYDAKAAVHDDAVKQWKAALDADPAYQTALKEYTATAAQARAAGQPEPRRLKPPVPEPAGPPGKRGDPAFLFNGMIAPLVPYAVRGVIWYQGENNASNPITATEYRTLFPALIADWRGLWKEGDFPFLYVQLANYGSPNSGWPLLREAQLRTLSLPKTGMAVTIDIGTGDNIHPPDKADVGARLALAARHVAYGEHLVYTGPIYEAMKPEGSGVRISFDRDSLGSGLTIGTAPWTDPKAAPVSKTELQGFVIAGEDEKWVEAQAKIENNTVVVSSAQVPRPVAVRYAWANNPSCNLYNKEGLPASPFRTDDWTSIPAPEAGGKKKP